MNERRRFILFELNEVPARVFRHYAGRHPRSAIATLLRRGQMWNTVTEDEGHLSPWITWPTVHRGVANDRHGIAALGEQRDRPDRDFPPVWTLLTAAGRTVGMFGSLHTYPLPADLAHYPFYVPDTFAAGPEAHPPELSAFQRFNLGMVDRSGRNVSTAVPIRESLRFLSRSAHLGLRAATIAKIAWQLTVERIWPHRSARRRTMQSLLSFDLFLKQLQTRRPDAAFYFTNHVASSLHRFWPATFTDDYRATQWQDAWVRRYAGELDYAVGEADRMIGDLLAFADRHPDYLVLVAGSMGQAAVDDPSKQVFAQVLLRDPARFVAALGVDGGWERRRTMEPTYTLAFDRPAAADAFIDALARLHIGGEPVPHKRLAGDGVEFTLGHHNLADNRFTVLLGNRAIDPDVAGLANVRIIDEVGAAAYHVPEGCLLSYDPRRDQGGQVIDGTVSTTRIAPTLLALQQVAPPPYMQPPLPNLVAAHHAFA